MGRTVADRYEIAEVIGRGGSAVVYRAHDRHLDRAVAIKVLSASAKSDRAAFLRARFAREARTAAGIRHSNVVVVHDHGVDAALGLDFLVMELLEGDDLGTLVGRFGLPRLRSTVAILRQAAAGVAAGHRAGLIHRDIKPRNLFVEVNESGFRVKVLDFGIAQLEQDREWTMASAGGETLHALSPAYASPEQLGGEARVTAASDVFSLGAVAHNLLTGERLWESLDPNRALIEMEGARTRLLEVRRLPLRLREVIVQALASHPADRFQDAREMLVALDEVHVSDTATPDEPEGVGEDRPRATAGAAPSPPRTRSPGTIGEGVLGVESAMILVATVAIFYLALAGAGRDPLASAMALFAAAALWPRAKGARGALARARLYAMAGSTVVLLGVMLLRAALGSVADLLFAQLVIAWLAPQVGGRAGRSENPGVGRGDG